MATGRVLSREEFEKPEAQARPAQEQPAVAAPEGALNGLAAGKEVKEDAQRVREDEGQVHPGRDVAQGREEEGRKDLELPAPNNPVTRKPK